MLELKHPESAQIKMTHCNMAQVKIKYIFNKYNDVSHVYVCNYDTKVKLDH